MWLPARAGAGEAAAAWPNGKFPSLCRSACAKAGEYGWAANPHLEWERLCGGGEDMLHGIVGQNILCESPSAHGVWELLGITSR